MSHSVHSRTEWGRECREISHLVQNGTKWEHQPRNRDRLLTYAHPAILEARGH